MNGRVKIEPRKEFWKHRNYRTVEKGKGWRIERPFEYDIEKGLEKLLRKKHKWE